MNEKRKLQKEFYEFCKSDEFRVEITNQIEGLKNQRSIERSMIIQKAFEIRQKVSFKSSPLDKIDTDLVFCEFYKVIKKKSELPRAQRELVYIIGMKALQKLRA